MSCGVTLMTASAAAGQATSPSSFVIVKTAARPGRVAAVASGYVHSGVIFRNRARILHLHALNFT